jgi:hypothetical protein
MRRLDGILRLSKRRRSRFDVPVPEVGLVVYAFFFFLLYLRALNSGVALMAFEWPFNEGNGPIELCW